MKTTKQDLRQQLELLFNTQDAFERGLANNLDYILQLKDILTRFGTQDSLMELVEQELQDLANFIHYISTTTETHDYSLTKDLFENWKTWYSKNPVYCYFREKQLEESEEAAKQTLKEDK